MKRREIEASGIIDDRGALRMYMGEINAFFKEWKGSRVVARFSVASRGSSEALKGYYYNYVVPVFRRGLWSLGDRKTEEQVERTLRKLSPIMYDQIPDIKSGKYDTRLREINELSNAELIEHIDTVKQLAAEYNIYIEDPRVI